MAKTDDELAERLDSLQEKQQSIIDKAAKLGEMSDGEQIAREGKALSKEGEKLEAEAKQLEKDVLEHQEAQREKAGVSMEREIVRVQLTDEQRKQITEETGVRIEVVELEEGADVTKRLMPKERPEYIMMLARKKAQRGKDETAGQEKAREAAREAMAVLENSPDPNMQRLAAQKKKDPEMRKLLGLDD